jgi:cytoskeletal protein CcmA (bactofilin family)
MSCLPQHTYSVYVDGELSPDDVREVESHLIQCQRCRGLIVALQEEGALLSDVLQQRESAVHSRPPARTRARGLAVGLVPSLAVGLLIVSVAGWLLDQRLPGMSWMNPLNLFGAYEMAFDAIFMLRDSAPVLFELGIAVGATAAMAAVLTFLMSALLRRMVANAAALLLCSLFGMASLFAASPSTALDLRWDQQAVEVRDGEVLEDTLIASAETVDIDGRVKGDVVALADRVTIRGVVEGNVFVAGREVLVTGRVDGSLHMACEHCSLEGEVTGNLYSAAEDVTIADSGRIGRDAQLFGRGILMDGRVARDLTAAAARIQIRGGVGRTARTHSERLMVLEEAKIGGDLIIQIAADGESQVAEGADIGGEVSETVVDHRMHERGNRWLDGGFYLRAFVFLVSAFLVGMLLHAVVPGLFQGSLATSGEFVRCLGYGFVALVAAPILLVLCAITVVGIPIAILGSFVYLTLLFVSAIVVASLVGSAITGGSAGGPWGASGFGVTLLLGLVLVIAVMNIPFVGGLLRLLIGLVGMGLVISTAVEMWQGRRSDYV